MMCKPVTVLQWVLVVIVVLTMRNGIDALELGERCVNPAGRSGRCVLLRGCQPLVDLFYKPNRTAKETTFLTESRCGTSNRKALICCAQLPEPPICGYQVSNRIAGGDSTVIKEFPWMALIVYKKFDNSVGFHCGGALINERYVLTAAHCVSSINRRSKVHQVRLGEWDLTTSEDCYNDSEENVICERPVVDLDIDHITVHSGFVVRDAPKADDIALIRLKSKVTFNDWIRPICLPVLESARLQNHEGTWATAAGWGKTENATLSEKKLKVLVQIKSVQNCSTFYTRKGILLKSTHLCAGGERGKDTCTGDSGGPLMRMVFGAWYLLGLVSFGPHECGKPGVPGVYTNVAEYMEWIRDNVY